MAEVLLQDSFSHWDINDRTVKWPFVSANSTSLQVSGLNGRNGAGARISTGSFSGLNAGVDGNSTNDAAVLERTFSSYATEWTVGMAFKFDDQELLYRNPVISFLDSSTIWTALGSTYFATQVALVFFTGMRFQFVRGSYKNSPLNTVGDASPPPKRGVWHFLEATVTIGGSGSVSLKMDGKTVISASGVNTNETGVAGANGVRIFDHKQTTIGSGGNIRTYYVDDIYVTTGGATFSGDVTVENQQPTGDGALSQWTRSTGVSNFGNVDETSPNDDTDYNTATAAGNIDTYTFPNLSATAGTVHGVTLNPVVKNNAFDSTTVRSVVRIGGVNYFSAAQASGTVLYRVRPGGFPTSPATGNKFTIAEVNGGEYGVERTT
jgi:hypothetical protein